AAARLEHTASTLRGTNELLETASVELNRRGLALLLADHHGSIVVSRGAELLGEPILRASFARGRILSEDEQGTNAVGTALAEDRAVAVIGPAHYDRALSGICCYAAPIHEQSGRVIGVIDATGPAAAADPLLGILIESLAATLESA